MLRDYKGDHILNESFKLISFPFDTTSDKKNK